MKMKMQRQHLSVELAHETLNEKARTVGLRFSTGAKVKRYPWLGEPYFLQFSMDPGHGRLDRLNNGAPLLKVHNNWSLESVLGVVEPGSARIENGVGLATVRFSERADVEPIWQDVKNKILRNVSMGVIPHKLKDVTPEDSKEKHYLATDWEPVELSAVPVPADPGAQFLSQRQQEFTEVEILDQGATMQTENKTTSDADRIRQHVKLAHFPPELAEDLISRGIGLKEANHEILERMAARSEETPIRSANIEVTRDHREGMLPAMIEALSSRYVPGTISNQAEQYRGASIKDLAREICLTNGLHVPWHSAERIIKLAMGTSDFPNLLQGTGQRMLLAAYQAAEAVIKRVCRRSTAEDFRTKHLLRLGEAPRLELVNEHGEIKYGSMAESKENYKIKTYAKIIPLTREAQINDDLGAFSDLTSAFGLSSANTEGQLIVDLLVSGSGDGPTLEDGVALFNLASHGTKQVVVQLSVTQRWERQDLP